MLTVCRATEKARSILKECSDSLSLATNSIPHTERMSNGVGRDEQMDTSSGSPSNNAAVTSKV